MFDDIYRVSDRSKLASVEEVLALEAIICCPFPIGYCEFVTRFGDGILTDWLRVHMPSRVRNEHRLFQERVGEFFDWAVDDSIATTRQVAESIRFGDTMNGDELIFHPSNPNRIVALPRHQERMHVAGNGLELAIDWLFTSEELVTPISLKAFEPYCHCQHIDFEHVPRCAGPHEVRQALLDLSIHDAHLSEDSEGDLRLELFVKEFGGYVVVKSEVDYTPPSEFSATWRNSETGEFYIDGIAMSTIPRRAKVWMRRDPDVSGPKYDAIISCLKSLGFQAR